MSVSRKQRIETYKAEGNLSSDQYKFVKRGTKDGTVVLAGANDKTVGILQNEPEDGLPAEVAMPAGGALLKISETVARGKQLTPTALGLGEVVDMAGENVGAIADVSGVANDVIGVEVTNMQAHVSDA